MIYLLWPTIRPTVFNKVHQIWKERASSEFKTIVCCNVSTDIKEDIIISDNPGRIGVCYPSYLLTKDLECLDSDIIILASDDFVPPINWDTYVMSKLTNEGCLMVRDGYQLPDSSNMLHPAITIPIMTFGCLKKLNKQIYNIAYNHMFSDCELYLNVKELGLLIDDRMTDTTTFEHHHYAAGKRNADVHDMSYNNKWKDDETTWNKRKNMKLEERLKQYETN